MDMLSQGTIPPRVPFAPTIYEHAAKLLNVTPSRLARDPDLIVRGQLAAYEMYGHDLISVGVDIYNVEAEAMGCPVRYYEDNTLPSVNGVLIKDLSDLENLELPDPAKDGRMPVMIEACEALKAEIGDEVYVSAAIVGPFTLAAILRGYEDFLTDLMFEEEFAAAQLKFAAEVGICYANALVKKGIGVAINESWITPPLLSPNLLRDRVLEVEKYTISNIKKAGAASVTLISGGNTTPIAEYLVQTGTSLLMADSQTDQKAYKLLCEKQNINLRASIDSKIVETGNEAEMESAAKKVIENCAANGRFIFGCGVVSLDTEPTNVVKLKHIVEKLNPYKAGA